MYKLIIGLIVVLTIILIGCAPMTTTYSAKGTEVKLNYINDLGMFHLPVVAELNVDQTKTTGTATHSAEGADIESLKAIAVANALSPKNADVLVEPRFSWENARGQVTVTVSGYPATYKNFRTITANDSLLIKNSERLYRINRYESTGSIGGSESQTKNSNKFRGLF